jgi:hypothetical protein
MQKKELIGNFKNHGREWRPQGQPKYVLVYDFIDRQAGRITPYGIYDSRHNHGFVNVGIDHDTAAFAVESIRRWWYADGQHLYPTATKLLITADGGGSNGSRTRLWKWEIQNLANETGLIISISHFSPGTSKWNSIEHRFFSFISINWRGQPLVNVETALNLIASTTTSTGLRVQCQLDKNLYPKGIKVSKNQFATIAIQRADFHGEWNYTIFPQASKL